MLEAKEKITKAVDALMELAASVQRGEVLLWTDIEQATGIARYTECWSTVVVKFRKRLLRERCIAVLPVTGSGLEFLTQQDQVRRIAEYRQRRMFRQSTRAVREIGAADPAQLCLHNRRLRLAQLERLKHERKHIRASVKEIRKTPVNPIRKMPASV